MKRMITVSMAVIMLISLMVPVYAEDFLNKPKNKYEEKIEELTITLDYKYVEIEELKIELNKKLEQIEKLEAELTGKESVIQELQSYLDEANAKNKDLEEAIDYYKNEIEKMADEFAAEREKLEAEISALKDKIDTMWNLYKPGGEYPDWSKYTLDQLIAMKDELPKIIEIRILEAYAEGML